MVRILLVSSMVLILLGVCIATPLGAEDDEIIKKYNEDSEKRFEEFLKHSHIPQINEGEIRHLKHDPNVHVYGKSERHFHTYSNINGNVKETKGGHELINNDGIVDEFDLPK